MLDESAKAAGKSAIATLFKDGKLSTEDATRLSQMTERGVSYADLMIAELGKEIATRYLAEEYVQHIEFTGEGLAFDKLSVPEVLMIENEQEEPWHQGAYSLLPGQKKFEQEAAELWHASLRKKGYKPDLDVTKWFNEHPAYSNIALKILKTVYTPSER